MKHQHSVIIGKILRKMFLCGSLMPEHFYMIK